MKFLSGLIALAFAWNLTAFADEPTTNETEKTTAEASEHPAGEKVATKEEHKKHTGKKAPHKKGAKPTTETKE